MRTESFTLAAKGGGESPVGGVKRRAASAQPDCGAPPAQPPAQDATPRRSARVSSERAGAGRRQSFDSAATFRHVLGGQAMLSVDERSSLSAQDAADSLAAEEMNYTQSLGGAGRKRTFGERPPPSPSSANPNRVKRSNSTGGICPADNFNSSY
ncbi:hypothetical protein TeGR_g4494 [Tetraparma gracilis]|uniref:Uncharacterized protein n=1 Tax=Tetraparma gracilis TaxID=2962635 RepID=A0ABQ6N3H4_9STRA|nr:hypothetical protein TeGR_g4494 [Tetraparma gracilis]